MSRKIEFSGYGLKWNSLETELMKYAYLGINKFIIKISTHYNRNVFKSNLVFHELELAEILHTLDKHGYKYKFKSRESRKSVGKIYRYLSINSITQLTPPSNSINSLISKVNFLLQCALNNNKKSILIPTNKKISSILTTAIVDFNNTKQIYELSNESGDIKSVEKRQLLLSINIIEKRGRDLIKISW